MLEIVRDLRRRASVIGSSNVLLIAADNSWTLCILEMPGLHVQGVAEVNQSNLKTASENRDGISRPVYVLALNREPDPAMMPVLSRVCSYGEPKSGLYKWEPASRPR